MSGAKSPVAAFLDGKTVVLGNLVPCAVNTLIGSILGIVGGYHGLVLVLDRIQKGEQVGPTAVLGVMFDDLVNRILFWIPFVAMMFALGVLSVGLAFIPVVGPLVSAALGLAAMLGISTIFPYALISVARDKTPWLKAWLGAIGRVKADVAGGGVYMLVTSILAGLGFFAFGVGSLVTVPMGILAQMKGFEAFGGLGAPPVEIPAAPAE